MLWEELSGNSEKVPLLIRNHESQKTAIVDSLYGLRVVGLVQRMHSQHILLFDIHLLYKLLQIETNQGIAADLIEKLLIDRSAFDVALFQSIDQLSKMILCLINNSHVCTPIQHFQTISPTIPTKRMRKSICNITRRPGSEYRMNMLFTTVVRERFESRWPAMSERSESNGGGGGSDYSRHPASHPYEAAANGVQFLLLQNCQGFLALALRAAQGWRRRD